MKIVNWKLLLSNFIKDAKTLGQLMEDNREQRFTFGYEEDCLREWRRRQYCDALDPEDKKDRLLVWKMKYLPQLFGRVWYDRPFTNLSDIERTEDDATQILLLLQRKASMNQQEKADL